jgi:hypothetical protein
MSLNFENASVLSLDKTINYFGSEYAFSCEKNISVQGFFYAGSNLEGVKEIQQDLDDFVASTDEKLHDVIINGHSFGKGKINSFSSTGGKSVRLKEYNVDLTIFENGDLTHLTGETYFEAFQGVISDPNRKFIRDISEDFSFSKSDGAYEYTHDLSLQFYDHGDAGVDEPMVLAKSLAKTILEADVDFGFLDSEVSGFYSLAHKKYYTETYDKVSKICTFSESYSQPAATSQVYSVVLKNSLDVDDGGVMSVQESGEVQALTNVSASTLSGYVSTELSGSFSRCQSLVASFNNGLFENPSLSLNSKTDHELVNQPIELSKSLNHFTGAASYSVSYDNSLNTSIGFISERTISADFNDEIATIKESGSVMGLGGPEFDETALHFKDNSDNIQSQFEKAIVGFKDIIEPGIPTRASSFYSDSFPDLTSDIKEISSHFNSDRSQGSVDYSKIYSNDPSRSNSNFKEIKTSEDVNMAVTFKNDFKILASGQATEQHKGITPSRKAVKINVSGKRETEESVCKEKAVELANSYAPSSMRDAHINSLSYNFSEKEKLYSLSVDWSYYENSSSLCSSTISIGDPAGRMKSIGGLVSLWRMDEVSAGEVRDLYGSNNGTRSFSDSELGKHGNAFSFNSGDVIDFGRGSGCPVSGPCTDPLPVYGPCPTPSATTSLNEVYPTPSGTWIPDSFPTTTLTAPFPTPTVSASASSGGLCLVDCPACGWDEIFTSKIFSISLWYKPASAGKVLIKKYDSASGNPPNPPAGTSRDNSFILTDGAYTQADGSTTTFTGGFQDSWNHLVITCSNGMGGSQNGICVYLNNAKIKEIDSPVFDKSNETSLIAGGDFEGGMDDLRVYNSALTPNNVSSIYSGEDLLPSGLSPYVPSTPTETP